MSNSVMNKKKGKILIVDDSEMNRDILSEMLGDEYQIIEAEDGAQAVALLQKNSVNIDLVLLDIVMPVMDGYDVLAVMNNKRWIDDIPVIMISAETSPTHIEHAYELGVSDFITRPFDAVVVRRRVVNTLMLYAKQKRLVGMVADQIYEKEKNSSMMINILSHIVEFRNGESGLHILHVQTFTDILLKRLVQITDKYPLSQTDISLISTASSLHDIGKISIPDEIINKPGKLTAEEFEIMKTHSAAGASVLSQITAYKDEPLVKFAHDICRWHHERYDGRGYPDGLKGDEIPISAQIVALADVYDALTSVRVYKAAYSHEKAMDMILGGECGTFNPILLQCLKDCDETIRTELTLNSVGRAAQKSMKAVSCELLCHDELSSSERTMQMLEHERSKTSFFTSLARCIIFDYTTEPPISSVNPYGADLLGIDQVIMHRNGISSTTCPAMPERDLFALKGIIYSTTPEQPDAQYDCKVRIHGEYRDMRFVCRTMWSSTDEPKIVGVCGKVIEVCGENGGANAYRITPHDPLTGLLTYEQAKHFMQQLIDSKPNSKFAAAVIDIDNFKSTNDKYGLVFGDDLLMHIAQRIRKCIKENDIACRIGGDEFGILIECKGNPKEEINGIFSELTNADEMMFPVSVSAGAAVEEVSGIDCSTLIARANRALYAAKKGGIAQLKFYDDSMRDMLSALSPINKIERKTMI